MEQVRLLFLKSYLEFIISRAEKYIHLPKLRIILSGLGIIYPSYNQEIGVLDLEIRFMTMLDISEP